MEEEGYVGCDVAVSEGEDDVAEEVEDESAAVSVVEGDVVEKAVV